MRCVHGVQSRVCVCGFSWSLPSQWILRFSASSGSAVASDVAACMIAQPCRTSPIPCRRNGRHSGGRLCAKMPWGLHKRACGTTQLRTSVEEAPSSFKRRVRKLILSGSTQHKCKSGRESEAKADQYNCSSDRQNGVRRALALNPLHNMWPHAHTAGMHTAATNVAAVHCDERAHHVRRKISNAINGIGADKHADALSDDGHEPESAAHEQSNSMGVMKPSHTSAC